MRSFPKLVAVVAGSVISIASGAGAATVFSDSFETPVNTRDWQVYKDNFGAWASNTGTGIEIQRSRVVVAAHDGRH